ncbi:MAG: flagellar hook-associated protein FlgK [Planctomycetes bacterium GWF2_41_51]|nr:MAG: flagellar hook-associated protein FlgK [Planctomycetes bacterium GWF2_41_51]HBG26604.1 flagellar hook-associated protein FlgK [Phycisphaerales bacterium]
MADYNIGLSGLGAIQKAFDVIGNNIANAATDGYHRQRVELSPAYFTQHGSVLIGGGVEVTDIRRVIDNLLEQEIYRQQSQLGQLAQETNTLRTIENAFGDFSTEDGGLNAAIDKFFTSLQDIQAGSSDTIMQNQLVSDANIMASQFRSLGEYITALESQLRLEADNTAETINTLVNQVAEFNSKIESVVMVDGNANAMQDQRDHAISQLSELIGVQTINRENGVVDVTAGGIPLVVGASASSIEIGITSKAELGIAVKGSSSYSTDIQGGKLAGLLSLKNEILSGIHNDLDTLAATIVQKINQSHVQGVGTAGAFTELTGWTNATEELADFENITAGYTYIRVIDTSNGSVVRTAIPVMQGASSDTLSEIADYITNNVSHVTATVNSSNQLTITAASGYEYDFLPAPLSEPKTADINFNGTNDPDVGISGIYTGSANDKLTFTVSGTGEIGVDNDLHLIVRDSAMNLIDTINIGQGYAAPSTITVKGTGIKIELSTGDLVHGDSFSIDVFANTDTSGLLAATGINTLFSGNSAINMNVCNDIMDNPARVATSLGADMNDNANVEKMFNLREEAFTELEGMTFGDYYRQIVADIGQDLSVKQLSKDNIEVLVLNLNNQQSEISGVDINEESANLLIYQQMFQAMAKYMSTISTMLDSVMEIL